MGSLYQFDKQVKVELHSAKYVPYHSSLFVTELNHSVAVGMSV